jgi:hypothetical protein
MCSGNRGRLDIEGLIWARNSTVRGAHAARVLNPAARRIHFWFTLHSRRASIEQSVAKAGQRHEGFGEPQKPTNQRRALPVSASKKSLAWRNNVLDFLQTQAV